MAALLSFSRHSRNRFVNWWWTVDKITLSCIMILIFIGAFLVFSSSTAVARTNHFHDYHYIKRQLIFIVAAIGIILACSVQPLKIIRRMAILGYALAVPLMLLTLFIGAETKGASRWIPLFGFTLQPSEFIKPTFIVVSAWLMDGSKKFEDFPGRLLSFALLLITCVLLFLQPDFGMMIIISLIWGFQLVLSGISLFWIMILGIIALIGGIGVYFTLDHVQARIHNFFVADGGYQVQKSMDSFASGNLFGRGPGEGIVKIHLPDAHTDFIFAVAGEEFGAWFCLLIVLLFSIIVIRSLWISLKDNNLFIVYAAAGLASSFGLQSIINMASTLHIAPTKGMTLPFISYGGSSIFASALTIGMLLAMTRRNSTAIDKDNSD